MTYLLKTRFHFLVFACFFTSLFPSRAGDEAGKLDPATIDAIMTPYILIHDTLAKDSLDGISQNAKSISGATRGNPALEEIGREADTLSGTHDLVAARAAFVALSKSLIILAKENHVTTYRQAYCPMVRESWLQKGDTVSNPFSADMATCGSIVELGSHLDKAR